MGVVLHHTLPGDILKLFIYLCVCFLAMPHGLWDLSSPTRDQSQAHGTESSKC